MFFCYAYICQEASEWARWFQESRGLNSVELKDAITTIAIGYTTRYEKHRQVRDIDLSINLSTKLREIAPPDTTYNLQALGHAYMQKYMVSGSRADLLSAIKVLEDGTALPPNEEPQVTLRLLSLLASAYREMCELFHTKQHGLKALENARTAYELALNREDSSDERLIYKVNLMASLSTMTTMTDDPIYLEEMLRLASTSEPISQFPGAALYESALGVMFNFQFERTKDISYLTRAVRHHQNAIELLPAESPQRGDVYHNLACAFRILFETTVPEDVTLLETSISYGEKSLLVTPIDHANRSLFLRFLGMSLELIGSTEQALSRYEEAIQVKSASPTIRIHCALSASRLVSDDNFPRLYHFLRMATNLLPLACPRSMSLSDQQPLFKRFSTLTRDATAAALNAGRDVLEALQLLELGRGILLGLIVDNRNVDDVTELRSMDDPHAKLLASRFEEQRQALDAQGSNDTSPTSPVTGFTKRQLFGDALEETIKEIRTTFMTNFLLPPSEREMLRLANKGPIVILNTSRYRNDAFIITDTITSLKLRFTYGELEEKVASYQVAVAKMGSGDENYADGVSNMKEILLWLWGVIAQPVLQYIEDWSMTQRDEAAMPRIWWIPTGLLTMLPIHAAGSHKKGSLQNVMSRVISSYAPTLKLLRYARERDQSSEEDDVIAVAMPDTFGKGTLPHATLELENLRKYFPARIVESTRSEVMASLESCTIAHISCHGISDLSEPSESRLLLKDWQANPLTMGIVAGMKLPKAHLAYLSACETALVRELSVLDEAIHIVTGFLLAGFPHVVGTLWEVEDRDAVLVSQSFYQRLHSESNQDIAAALHHAVRLCIKGTIVCKKDDPLRWAAFIHVGA